MAVAEVKKDVRGKCLSCRATFAEGDMDGMFRHSDRTGHITQWRYWKEWTYKTDEGEP